MLSPSDGHLFEDPQEAPTICRALESDVIDLEQGQIFCFDKPLRWTSFDLVNRAHCLIKRIMGVKKVKIGHAGTLDPLASGVLIVCTGRKTKLIESLQYKTKEYVAGLQFGQTTPSFDLETEPDASFPIGHLSASVISEALKGFLGQISQVPPVYSAVKVGGKRAYEYARKGREVELKPKILVIDQIELLQWSPESCQAVIRVVCSKGTYIRALARDIGLAVNSGAHLFSLRRTRIGNLTTDDCINMDSFEALLLRSAARLQQSGSQPQITPQSQITPQPQHQPQSPPILGQD